MTNSKVDVDTYRTLSGEPKIRFGVNLTYETLTLAEAQQLIVDLTDAVNELNHVKLKS